MLWMAVENLHTTVVKAEDAELRWLGDYLSFKDSSAFFKNRGRARGHVSEKVRLFNVLNHTFPTGLLPLVQRAAPDEGFQLNIVDKRGAPPARDEGANLGWLRDYQLAAVDAVEEHERGILWMPTGAGKTEVAAALTLAFPFPWLFLVHRAGLMDQAARRYELRTGMRAGRIGEGEWTTGDGNLVCATFQTISAGLAKRDPKTLALLQGARGVMVDEAHVLPAGSFYNVALATPNARHRIGLSGTPLARGDNRSTMAIAALGPVIYRIRTELLISRGVLARPTIHMVQVNERSDKPTWQGVYGESIVRSTYRNKHVIEACRRAEKPGLLFVKEVKHGKLLTKALLKAGIQADFVWGTHSTEYRNARIRDLVKGKLDILVCSVVFQEGIDIPELRSAVFASGGKSIIATLQRLGRGMRVERNAAGDVVKGTFEAWDIADNGCGCTSYKKGDPHQGCKWLEKHTRERLKAYSSEGHAVVKETFPIVLRAGEATTAAE